MADLPWDASRCLRLLRPLKAHLAALERERQRNLDKRTAVRTERPITKPSANDQSPDWFGRSAARIKRARKTYAKTSRPNHDATQHAQPSRAGQMMLNGHIKIPQTFMIHADQDTVPQASNAESRHTEAPRAGPSRKKHRSLPTFNGVRNDDNVRGAVTSYLAIEAATKPNSAHTETAARPPPVYGAASLRLTAVKSLAAHIEREATSQLVLTAEERYNVSEHIYCELDEFHLPRERGLCLQAQLIRAHATRIVCNALRMQFISPRAGISIVDRMSSASSKEQEQILAAVAYGIRPDRQFQNCLQDPMIPQINHLLQFSKDRYVGCEASDGYISRTILAQLLQNPSFPVEWLATQPYRDQWQHLVTDIACHSQQYYNARSLMRKILRSSCGIDKAFTRRQQTLKTVPVMKHGLSTTQHKNCSACSHKGVREQQIIKETFGKSICSFLTILTALVMVGSDEYNDMHDSASQRSMNVNINCIISVLHEIAIDVLQHQREDWNSEDLEHAKQFGARSAAILLCQLISQTMLSNVESHASCDPQMLIEAIIELERSFAYADYDLCEELASLITNICNAAAQISTIGAADWLHAIVLQLDAIEGVTTWGRHDMQRLLSATALDMGLSQPYDVTDDSIAAVETLTATPGRPRVPLMAGAWDSTGYRWEPMLSEWVSATPLQLPPRPDRTVRSLPRTTRRGTDQLQDDAASTSDVEPELMHITASARMPRNTTNGTHVLRDGRLGSTIIDNSASESELDTTQTSSPFIRVSNAKIAMGPPPTPVARTMIDVYVPRMQQDEHVRRISDLVPWSSPVSLAAAFPSSSPAPAVKPPAQKRLRQLSPPSPPTSPLRAISNADSRINQNLRRKRSSQQSHQSARESDDDEFDNLDRDSDAENRPKRRRMRLARKASEATDTRRHSGRLRRHQHSVLESEADELA